MANSYISKKEIERRANELISRYEQAHGSIFAPVPVEKMAENMLDLVLEWNSIPEPLNEIIYAGLNPVQRKVVFNQSRTRDYERFEGLYNTVLAHEIGHWVLHVDSAHLDAQISLPGTNVAEKFIYRSIGPSNSLEWQAHSFMSFLVLPYGLLRRYISKENLCDWQTLYEIKETFDVTISVVTMRLQKMGLIYIEGKQIYPSEAVANGQMPLI